MRSQSATDRPTKWYRARALRERYGISRQTIYVWRKTGVLPEPVRLGPNVVAWSDVQIEEFERRRGA